MTAVQSSVASRKQPEQEQQPPGQRRSVTSGSALHFAERWALVGLLLLVIAFFSFYSKTGGVFATSANAGVVTGNQAVIALLALAAMFPLIAGHFDFSVGANSALSSVLCASLMSHHHTPLLLAIVASVALGTAIGAVNGILVARFELSAFIITLGASTLLGGIFSWDTKGQTIATGISQSLTGFGSDAIFGIPQLVYLVLVIAIACWYLLGQTPFGRKLYAIGANARAARLVGVRVRREVFLSFLIAGALAGVAGVLSTARTGGATADPGTSLLFPAIAAVFLGATAVRPGQFNVIGTMVGVLFVAASVSGLTLAGAADWVQPVFNGTALIVAVGLSTYLRRRRVGAGQT